MDKDQIERAIADHEKRLNRLEEFMQQFKGALTDRKMLKTFHELEEHLRQARTSTDPLGR